MDDTSLVPISVFGSALGLILILIFIEMPFIFRLILILLTLIIPVVIGKTIEIHYNNKVQEYI